jgi:hypothetical protein
VGKLCTYQCWFLALGDDGYLGIGMGALHCPQYCLPLAWEGLSGLGNQRIFVAYCTAKNKHWFYDKRDHPHVKQVTNRLAVW